VGGTIRQKAGQYCII